MSGMNEPELWLVRHGETEWSRDGRHTSVTDLPLLPDSEAEATALGERLDRSGRLGRWTGGSRAGSRPG